jgi:hypothetical protein
MIQFVCLKSFVQNGAVSLIKGVALLTKGCHLVRKGNCEALEILFNLQRSH